MTCRLAPRTGDAVVTPLASPRCAPPTPRSAWLSAWLTSLSARPAAHVGVFFGVGMAAALLLIGGGLL